MGAREETVDECVKLAPRFVWLEVEPEEACDWLRELASRRVPVAIVPPLTVSIASYDEALGDERVAGLATAFAFPRLYEAGLGRMLALARKVDGTRLARIEGTLVATGVRELSPRRRVAARARRGVGGGCARAGRHHDPARSGPAREALRE